MRYADDLITEAISLNWERLNENWVRAQKQLLPSAQFLWQHATVRIDIGRAGGYTTFIKDNAIQTDLIIVKNQFMIKEFVRGRIYTLESIIDYNALVSASVKPEKVWVDSATLVLDSAIKVERFYQEMAKLGVNQIIMLG